MKSWIIRNNISICLYDENIYTYIFLNYFLSFQRCFLFRSCLPRCFLPLQKSRTVRDIGGFVACLLAFPTHHFRKQQKNSCETYCKTWDNIDIEIDLNLHGRAHNIVKEKQVLGIGLLIHAILLTCVQLIIYFSNSDIELQKCPNHRM